MKITEEHLREIIVEEIKASPEFLKKEHVREKLQQLILGELANIDSQEKLNDLFATIEMATRALKQVPLEVFMKIKK